MPAVSKAQREAMAIAEHHPGQLYKRNRGMLGMRRSQLHDFAATPQFGMPNHVQHGLPSLKAIARKKARHG